MVLTVRDVMSTSVHRVQRSTLLKEVARLLVDKGISGAPVVDVDGSVIGVVSEADLPVKEHSDLARPSLDAEFPFRSR